jgi:hypothetical protein
VMLLAQGLERRFIRTARGAHGRRLEPDRAGDGTEKSLAQGPSLARARLRPRFHFADAVSPTTVGVSPAIEFDGSRRTNRPSQNGRRPATSAREKLNVALTLRVQRAR